MTVDIDAVRRRLATALGHELELGELLGAGGFAAVFRARDPRLQRDVAIKVLDPALGITADLEEQFLREARIVASVEHPHIVPLYAAEARDGLLFLVMRLLPGRTLADRIADAGPLTPAEAARVAHDVAEALALAHASGVVHRDIKPENILLDADGNAAVTDFGISVVTGRAVVEAAEGITVGTPSYMSPEQALGEPVDGRTDVYALGVILFEMLVGRVPFTGRTVQELVAMHIAAPPPNLTSVRPDTPPALAELVARMLTKRADARPDAAAVVHALAAARTPDALLSPAEQQRRRRRKRFRYAAIVGGTAAVVVVGGVIVAVRSIVGVSRMLSSGPPPGLDALGIAVPDSVTEAFRASGALAPGDTPTYAFIPARGGLRSAMVLTDSVLVYLAPSGPQRIPYATADFQFNYNKRPRSDANVGTLILALPGGRVDTVYSTLGGLEFSRLRTSVMSLLRTHPP